MEQRLTIVSLGVADLVESTRFYEECFGWKRNEASNEFITFFTLNGIMLGLYERVALAMDAKVSPEGQGFRGQNLAYNTRTREEVDHCIEQLRGKGVRMVKEPQDVHWGGYSGYVSDPDGHLWEIAYNPFLLLDQQGNVPGGI